MAPLSFHPLTNTLHSRSQISTDPSTSSLNPSGTHTSIHHLRICAPTWPYSIHYGFLRSSIHTIFTHHSIGPFYSHPSSITLTRAHVPFPSFSLPHIPYTLITSFLFAFTLSLLRTLIMLPFISYLIDLTEHRHILQGRYFKAENGEKSYVKSQFFIFSYMLWLQFGQQRQCLFLM